MQDWRDIKKYTPVSIETAVKAFANYTGFKFITEPYHHQNVMVYIMNSISNFIFFLDMGVGKTKGIIDGIRLLKTRKKILKNVLIVVPNVLSIATWGKEIATHGNDLNFYGLFGTTPQRKELLKNMSNDFNICVINYAGLCYLCCSKHSFTNKLKIDTNYISELQKKFDMVVFDEIHFCKSKTTLTYKVCKMFSENIKFVYGMTGTPFGRNLLDLWSQFFLVDKGEALTASFSLFRRMYFIERKNIGFPGNTFEFNQNKYPQLIENMSKRSISYRTNELLDLPEKRYLSITCSLPSILRSFYQKAIEQKNSELQQQLDIKNTFMKARQISSGFLIVDKKPQDLITKNHRIEALSSILDSVTTQQVIIFCEFRHSALLISNLLKKLNYSFSIFRSGDKTNAEEMQKFLQGDTQILLSNSRVGGTSLNLQVATIMIYFESPVSPIIRYQSEARIYRAGQQYPVTFIDIVVENTIETKVLFYVKEGKDLLDLILKGKEVL